ncbi:MAG TPA: hypothetical protein EYQ50_03940 [Verrucomicrobiales bacterium]|nr:hypothetical protein [Verrucomicrobiales bacterium]
MPKLKTHLEKVRSDENVIVKVTDFESNPSIPKKFEQSPGVYGINPWFIILNKQFIEKPEASYPDDRMVGVLYHELGHVKYRKKIDPVTPDMKDDEFQAFSYSLKKCYAIAQADGDSGPLDTSTRGILNRSKNPNENPEYLKAIHRCPIENGKKVG